MGGRGGSSGGGGATIKNALPGSPSFKIEEFGKLPKLNGTEKQVRYAERLREETLSDLWNYTSNYDSNGNRSNKVFTYAKGKEAMMAEINSDQLINMTSGETRKQKVSQAVAGYVDAAKRLERYYSISQNNSAKFWIDNHGKGELRKRIDGKK